MNVHVIEIEIERLVIISVMCVYDIVLRMVYKLTQDQSDQSFAMNPHSLINDTLNNHLKKMHALQYQSISMYINVWTSLSH